MSILIRCAPPESRTARGLAPIVLVACAVLLGAALFLQEAMGLQPCPLCVAQRLAYWMVGIVALAATLHGAIGAARRRYGMFIALFSVAGFVLAARHVWLLRHPAGGLDCAVSPEEAFINALPLAQWWPQMFAAAGDCAKAAWRLMGLTVPEWSMISFTMLALAGMCMLRARRA